MRSLLANYLSNAPLMGVVILPLVLGVGSRYALLECQVLERIHTTPIGLVLSDVEKLFVCRSRPF